MQLTKTLLLIAALGLAEARGFGNGQGTGRGQGQGQGQGQGASSAVSSAAAANTVASASEAAAATTASEAAAATSSVSTANTGTGTGTGAAVNGQGSGNSELALNPENVQTASDSPGGASAEAGQANSNTDPANFINHCTGKVTTNGTQNTAGSCNGVIMGDIPASTNMISSIITFPAPGQNLQQNTTFNVSVQVQGLNAGSFTNPATTYYAAPQELGSGGNIIGHTHVTIQDLGGSLTPNTPPDPAKFVFFKGINDDGNGQGGLSATVTGGLVPGTYRVCTMTSASNHQPVLMPVAQRGAQDDCQKFTVGGSASNQKVDPNYVNQSSGDEVQNGGNTSGDTVSATTKGAAAPTGSGSKGTTGTGAGTGVGSGAANNGTSTSTTSTANQGKGQGQGQTGKGRVGGFKRFAERAFVA